MKKTILPAIFLIGSITQTAVAQENNGQHDNNSIHFAAGEALQMSDKELGVILVGEVCREDLYLGVLGNHDIASEVGIVFRKGESEKNESTVFIAPKIEIVRALGCKLFFRENVEFIDETLRFVPGVTLEIPLQVGPTKAHRFVAGTVEKDDGKYGSPGWEMGLTVDLK